MTKPSVQIVRQKFVYTEADYPSCHAATITSTSKGELLAAWFGGTHESHPDVCIYGATRIEGSWQPQRLIARPPIGQSCYNPVLFRSSDDSIWLFYKAGTGPGTWKGWMSLSYDDGLTWIDPVRLPDRFWGPIKNKPIELEDAVLVFPSSTEDRGWRVHFEFLDLTTWHWSKTGSLNKPKEIGAIQPSILRRSDGSYFAIGRTQQGRLFHIQSDETCSEWGQMTLLDVPNPNAGTDAITLSNGWHLLAYNPSETERTPLSIAVSRDGFTWKKVLDLETEPGEYSYPTLLELCPDEVHVVYTWRRERIRQAILSVRA